MKTNNEIKHPVDISFDRIKEMTQDFDIISFYKECQDSLAVIMITQRQVITVYWNINDEINNHDRMIKILLSILNEIEEKTIITLRLANENIYDLDSDEEEIEDVNRLFSSGISANEEGITSKMIDVVRMLLEKISDLDVIHDNIGDLERMIYNKTDEINNKDKIIIGIPIDEYIHKLNIKVQEANESVITELEEPEL